MRSLHKNKYGEIKPKAARDFVLGMNQRQIADKYGIHENTIWMWLKYGVVHDEVERLRALIKQLP